MDESLLDRGLASLRTRTLVSLTVIYIFLASCLVQGAIDIADLAGAIDLRALPSQSVADAVNALAAGRSLLYLFSAIVIAFWIYRAHQNLFDAGVESLEFTAGWSIGWFIVPFASLYMPYKAMRELWHVSLGEHGGFSEPAPPVLVAWWASFLISNFAAYGTGIPALDLIAVGAKIVSAWLLRGIIVRITDAQKTTLNVAETFA